MKKRLSVFVLALLFLVSCEKQKSISNVSEKINNIMEGIAYVETSMDTNPYTSLSIKSKNGDRAYGKWQIMGNYIPTWTKEALGKSYTKEQFLARPDIQYKTVYIRIQGYVKNGTSAQDMACIWFSGRSCKKAGNSRDAYGTTVPQYLKKFNEKYCQLSGEC